MFRTSIPSNPQPITASATKNLIGLLCLTVVLLVNLSACGSGTEKKKVIGLIDKSKIDVDDKLRELFLQGVQFMKQGNYPQAITIMNQVITEDDRLPGPVTNLGIIYLNLGEEEKSVKYLQQAVTMDPTQAGAFNVLAYMHREKGEFQESLGLYNRAIEYNPDYTMSYYNLGVLCDIYLRDPQCAYDNFILYNEKIEPKDPLVENWIDELERR